MKNLKLKKMFTAETGIEYQHTNGWPMRSYTKWLEKKHSDHLAEKKILVDALENIVNVDSCTNNSVNGTAIQIAQSALSQLSDDKGGQK